MRGHSAHPVLPHRCCHESGSALFAVVSEARRAQINACRHADLARHLARHPSRGVVTFDSCGVFVDRRSTTKTRRCAETAPARWPSRACRRTAVRRSATSAGRPPESWWLVLRAAVVASARRSVRGVSTSQNRPDDGARSVDPGVDPRMRARAPRVRSFPG